MSEDKKQHSEESPKEVQKLDLGEVQPVAQSDQNEAGWQFNESDNQENTTLDSAYDENSQLPTESHNQHKKLPMVTWQAKEFIENHKNPLWFVGLGVVTLVIATIVYFYSGSRGEREILSPIVITIMGIIFGVFASRKPQTLDYVIDNHGIQIGSKHYQFSQFKSFALMSEGGPVSILLLPLKRFMPSISLYYVDTDQEKIVEALSSYLPMEQRSHDLTDRLMHKIGF